VIRPRQVVGALAVAARNADIRRAELAWGASVAAERAHFVALGVFAYDRRDVRGRSSAPRPAAAVAVIGPVAATLGDRSRRERFLLVVSLGGAAALEAHAVATARLAEG